MLNKINMAIQVIPFAKEKNVYNIVDQAIQVIKDAGVKHRVCPFETVVEGEFDLLTDMIKKIQETCFIHGAYEMITNIRIHARKDGNVTIEEKMYKYE